MFQTVSIGLECIEELDGTSSVEAFTSTVWYRSTAQIG